MRKLGDLSRSTIFKVSAVFALILLSTVGFMGGFVFWSTVGFMDRQTNVLIETDIEGLAEIYRRDGLRGLITTIESRIERDPVRSSIISSPIVRARRWWVTFRPGPTPPLIKPDGSSSV